MIINKTATYEIFYKLFGEPINTVFNGEKWLSLLTDSEIYQRAVKILLKTSDKVYETKYRENDLPAIKESYKDWYTNEDVITIGSSNIEDYQELVDKNRDTALKMGSWKLRMQQIQEWLKSVNYQI